VRLSESESKLEDHFGDDCEMLNRLGTDLDELTEVAAASGVPVETLRKIETGRIATPAFFTVAALAASVGLSLEDVVAYCADPGTGQSLSA
jgi:hypothetical protein